MELVSKLNDMMDSIKYNKLCMPSKIYLIIGVVSIVFAVSPVILMALKRRTLFSKNTFVILTNYLIAVLMVIFWTFILQLLCTSNYELFSWIIVLSRIFLVLFVSIMVFTFKPKQVKKISNPELKKMVKEMRKMEKGKKRNKRKA